MVFRPEDWEADGVARWPRAPEAGERAHPGRTTDTPLGNGWLPEVPPAEAASARARFDFHGLVIDVVSRPPLPLLELRRELATFARGDGVVRADGHVDMQVAQPAWEDLPDLAEASATPRNVCFRDGDTTWIDYFGRGLAVVDWRARRCSVRAPDASVARDIARAFLLAAAGRALDERGLHRVDALGLSHEGRGILLLLAAGETRDRLAAELLARRAFRLLGEDTPLLDGSARLVPFPLRLTEPAAPVGEVSPAKLLVVAARGLGAASRIDGWSKPAALRALVKHMRFAGDPGDRPELEPPPCASEVARRCHIGASRARSALRLLAAARPFRFVVGRDLRRAAATLADFLG